MSGEAVHVQLSPAGLLPTSFPVVLKKILEMPPPNILDGDDGKTVFCYMFIYNVYKIYDQVRGRTSLIDFPVHLQFV